MSDSKIYQLQRLEEKMAELQDDLRKHQEEAQALRVEVDEAIREAAARFLVDKQGEPADGVLYWYSRRAIVRLGTLVAIVPVLTMNDEKIWPPKIEQPEDPPAPEQEGEGEGANCSDCDAPVSPDDQYYATPCGTFCDSCMSEHMAACEICRHEFA